MSITHVKPYFVSRCKALGYKEHTDAFNTTTVPKTGKWFHVQLNGERRDSGDGRMIQSTADVAVKLFSKASKDTAKIVDDLIADSESHKVECVKRFNIA